MMQRFAAATFDQFFGISHSTVDLEFKIPMFPGGMLKGSSYGES